MVFLSLNFIPEVYELFSCQIMHFLHIFHRPPCLLYFVLL